MMHKKNPTAAATLTLILLFAGLLSACSGYTASTTADGKITMASMAGMPEEVKTAPPAVQQAYQFAVANSDLMTQIPCYCGCGDMGHTSNYACYVQDVDSQGAITYDTHALGCSICVDITLDAMRMLEQGKTAGEIKTIVDQTYSQYGPSNIP